MSVRFFFACAAMLALTLPSLTAAAPRRAGGVMRHCHPYRYRWHRHRPWR
jgi:hypothetical protein